MRVTEACLGKGMHKGIRRGVWGGLSLHTRGQIGR